MGLPESFATIRRPADEAAVLRHDKNAVGLASAADEQAVPDLALFTAAAVILDELTVGQHVGDEILIIERRKLDLRDDPVGALLLDQVRHHQIFDPARALHKVRVAVVVHLFLSLFV